MPVVLASAVKAGIAAVLSITLSAAPVTKPKAVPVKAKSTISATDAKLVNLTRDTVAALQPVGRAAVKPGTWKNSSGCWRCDAGPGLALAASAAVTGDSTKRTAAEKIFDQMIAAHPTAGDIDSMFFSTELGVATVLLKPSLDAKRKATWTAAVKKSADFLVANKNLSSYTNGNIVVGNALVMALAARLTGDHRYQDYYETALSFADTPSQQRWPGFGFRTVKKPTAANGVGGKGYFTETGVDGPGYDAEYTVLQLDQLARIYLINKDPRVMRYMNMVLGQLMDRVNVKTWTLDTSGGTRHPQIGRKVVFDTAALTTLANLGGRKDLTKYLPTQQKAIETLFRSSFSDFGDRHKYAIGMITASIIMSEPANARLR